MFIVGLTGGFATGKTAVAGVFRRYGARIIDADAIVHRLLRPAGGCVKPVAKAFGSHIVKRGAVDRAALSAVVFKNPRALGRLCSIIHPVVIKEVRKKIAAYRRAGYRGVVVIDAPLLIEAGLHRMVDIIVVVMANQRQQIARACTRRGMTRSEALRRIRSQMPMSKKIQSADIVIDNRTTYTAARRQAEAAWKRIQHIHAPSRGTITR